MRGSVHAFLNLTALTLALCWLNAAFCAPPARLPEIVGVGTHFGFQKHQGEAAVKAVAQGGFHAIRDEVFWSHMERDKGKLKVPAAVVDLLRLAKRKNIKILLVLGYGNDAYGPRVKPLPAEVLAGYTRYVDVLSRELGALVWGYEIWNEWDWKTGGYNPGSAESYMSLVRAVRPVLRRNCPTCKVLGGSITYKGILAGRHVALLRLGLMDFVDGMSLHPYVESFGKLKNHPIYLAKWLDSIEQDARQVTHAEVPLYITEIGWSESNGYTRPEVASFVEQTLNELGQRNYIKGVWWYELQDSGTNTKDGEQNYGLIDFHGHEKAAYLRFSNMLK